MYVRACIACSFLYDVLVTCMNLMRFVCVYVCVCVLRMCMRAFRFVRALGCVVGFVSLTVSSLGCRFRCYVVILGFILGGSYFILFSWDGIGFLGLGSPFWDGMVA